MSRADSKIPMLDLSAPHVELEEEILEAFSAVLASGRFVLGDAVAAFESELARLCEAPIALGCNSGTDALWLALRALGIGPGDDVLCPAYSFFATAATIVRLGGRPIFIDIDPVSLTLDPAHALRLLETSDRIRAIVTVDLFGRLCELGPLESACRERGIAIVEDAAQSIGSLDSAGDPVGAHARVACFSFYPTKNLGALGDAGAIVTADADLAQTIARLRVHGESSPGVYEEIGINSRLDALQAAALSTKLRHLESWTRERRRLAHHYDTLFAQHGARPSEVRIAMDESGAIPLQTPAPDTGRGRHTYHRYVVRVGAGRRDGLIEALRQEGIGCEVYYSHGLHEQPVLRPFAPPDGLEETERACRETLALPLFPELGLERVERVVAAVVRHLET